MAEIKGDKKTETSNEHTKDSNRVVVKKTNIVAYWTYDVENENCAICHNHLAAPCLSCNAEPQSARDCSIAWGQCSHSYHFHCITKWLLKRTICPLDNEEWDFVSM